MKFLFLVDQPQSINPKKDTSLALMDCAQKRNHNIYICQDGDIILKNDKLYFDACRIKVNRQDEIPISLIEAFQTCEDEFDAVFIRNDPPFDEQYLLNTWLLDRISQRIVVVNRPEGLRTVNEKIWVTRFPQYIPKTIISRKKLELRDFFKTHKTVVAKPTNSYGGSKVFLINEGDNNAHVILETLTENYEKDIILQKFVKDANMGDKRILLLDGEFLGAVLRVHSKDDHRNNFFSGGEPMACDITEREHEIIDEIAPHLRDLGLFLVGIDVIGDYLIEVNVTSPTCLQEIERLTGEDLGTPVIAQIENMVKERKMK